MWDAALSLGEAAHAWGDKARLKLLLLEETTLGSLRSTSFVGMVALTLTLTLALALALALTLTLALTPTLALTLTLARSSSP